jgi:chemotaxis signal transduction protein
MNTLATSPKAPRSLSTRLQREEKGVALPHLVFLINDFPYACKISEFEKVVRRDDAVILAPFEPDCPWWSGVYFEEGEGSPVLSVRVLMGFPHIDHPTGLVSKDALIICGEHQNRRVFLVDGCAGVINLDVFQSSRLRIPPSLIQNRLSCYETVLPWRDQLLVTLKLHQILTSDILEQSRMVMEKQKSLVEQLQELREAERKLAQTPSVKGYLDLADRYTAFGLPKDTERLMLLAERLEAGGGTSSGAEDSLMSGAVNPMMLVEVLQILSRTSRTGDLVLESADQTFHIYFDKGQIISATSTTHEEGLPSFNMAIRMAGGMYRFTEKEDLQIPRIIKLGSDHLIMEAVRLMDESSKPSEG